MYASTYIYLNKQRGQENKEEETEKTHCNLHWFVNHKSFR